MEKNQPFTKEVFFNLGFLPIKETLKDGLVWYVNYCYVQKNPFKEGERDTVTIEWSAANKRYNIYRDTERIRNIHLFEGFINTTEQLELLLSLFDLKDYPFNKVLA
jgi:hypothetical protein